MRPDTERRTPERTGSTRVHASRPRGGNFEYVMRNKAVMPRTALRYAIEKMPKELKAEAMKK